MRPLKYLITALLALASSSAMALGLGDIRVLSRPGQPLLAEIPVISADPSELQNLRVGLAAPATFERVGLQRPSGLVGELQFELTRNTQGRAVVRVTSQTPVDTPSLAFLVEADWGQGRLVREYSALVDAPTSAAAVSEPEIVAPAGALSNAIVREPQATVAAPVPARKDAEPSPARPSESARPAAPAASTPTLADGSTAVRRGQTLSGIAQEFAREQQVSRDRAMIALLRANPDAFIRGNINLLKQGAVLRLPDAAALAAVDAADASAMVREHAAQWRQARAIPQPASTADSAASAPTGSAQTPSGARLEIAPAAAAATAAAGTTTGTGDGNEGDMLGNEQLRQAREDIATRDAEIDELKQRVAELEKLQASQQSLVELKDTELAAAQARLGQAPGERESGGTWYWLGLPVLLLAVLGWWLSRRRRPSPLPPLRRDDRDDSALSASVPAGAGLDVLAERAPWQEPDAPAEEAEPAVHAGSMVHEDTGPAVRTAEWHDDPATAADAVYFQEQAAEHADVADEATVAALVPGYARDAEQRDDYRGVFEAPADDPADDLVALDAELEAAGNGAFDDGDPSAAGAAAGEGVDRAGHERLELAIACLDLGEDQTARMLLEELQHSDDAALRAQAQELLARLG